MSRATAAVVKVRRILVAEYTVPLTHYPDMSQEEIRAMESDVEVDPSVLLENVVRESAEVAFFDSAEEAAAHTWDT